MTQVFEKMSDLLDEADEHGWTIECWNITRATFRVIMMSHDNFKYVTWPNGMGGIETMHVFGIPVTKLDNDHDKVVLQARYKARGGWRTTHTMIKPWLPTSEVEARIDHMVQHQALGELFLLD